jgi:hypothetical protein
MTNELRNCEQLAKEEVPIVEEEKTALYNIMNKYADKYIQKGCRGYGSYDSFRANLYGKVDQPKTIDFLLENWTLLDFDYGELEKYTNTNNYNVLFEMKKVLMMAVLSNFDLDCHLFKKSQEKNASNYHLTYNIEFDKDKETQKLRPILTEILRKALFRRMAQQTIYGFI